MPSIYPIKWQRGMRYCSSSDNGIVCNAAELGEERFPYLGEVVERRINF
jgi:hypothetical protein